MPALASTRDTTLDAFCAFAGQYLTDERGNTLVIEPWQREILADYFGGCRELVTLISKKNGKTSLFAGLALWHLITVDFADVAILAASRDQAGKLLQQLTGYIKRHPDLSARLRITQRTVHCDGTHGKVAVQAADSDTLDGWGGTLALVDELGRHKSAENFGLLRDGLGPRDGQLVAFSTAGDDEESALGKIRASAHAMDGFEIDPENPKHRRVRNEDFSFHEWALDPGDDVDDLDLVLLANPASWIDRAELEARRDSPSMQRWQWQRFTCGLWVAGSEDAAISQKEWEACADPKAEIPAGAKSVFIGVDLGWKWDCTAFVPIWRPAGVAKRQSVYEARFLPAEERCGYALCERAGKLRQWSSEWETHKQRFCNGHAPAGSKLLEPEEEPEPEPEDLTIIVGEPAILVPPQDGTSLDAEDVFAIAAHYVERFDRPRFVLDPEAGGEQLGQRIESELKVEVLTHSQKSTAMCRASQNLAETIGAGGLRHPNHPGLNAHVLAATAKWVGPMWRLMKPKGKKLPIDGAIALAMAVNALGDQPPPSVMGLVPLGEIPSVLR